MRSIFRKTGTESQISYEVAGLSWLRTRNGAEIVQVLDSGPGWLEEPRLRQEHPTPSQARRFGAQLARTHAAGADWLGQAPPGFEGDGSVGSARIPLPERDEAPSTWGAFFAEFRIRPYLQAFRGRDRQILDELCEALAEGTWDHPQPSLVTAPAARTHGDLWGGNVLWTAGGAVLIDPLAAGGHAETDLANLGLFGAPHLAEIIAGYQSVSALASGWQERVKLHQMHLLVIHAYLFGGGYIHQSVEVAGRYLKTRP